MSELSNFTFDMACKAQDALKIGPRMYHEMKSVFICGDFDSGYGLTKHPSGTVRRYLLLSAMKTKDIEVRGRKESR